ncbi:hypothetical protein QM042_12520 [Escherichia coli]|uniref:hypothetical protein n=1 Tax=Escherichia coli TaxID=562 RepID=UPI0039874601
MLAIDTSVPVSVTGGLSAGEFSLEQDFRCGYCLYGEIRPSANGDDRHHPQP